MARRSTLVLGRAEIRRSIALADYVAAVVASFRDHAEGRLIVPAVVHIPGRGGAFHVKSAGQRDGPRYVAVKVNGNFPDNPRTTGMPTIQGAIVLCDGRDGSLLAVMDSIEVTAMRTGAATAVAARYLAPRSAAVATVVGCGVQGRVQLWSLLEILSLQTIYAFDTDVRQRSAFVSEMSANAGLEIIAIDDLRAATQNSQVIVTCTSSRKPFLSLDHVVPGTFVAAVGADNDDKQELHTDLVAQSKLVVDIMEQCAEFGELHHALAAGMMTRADVVAELADVVTGASAVFEPEDIIVFDSTGSAIQDVAAAGVIYERAVASGTGIPLEFA
jgi:ornithine cyclodeaminase/alanine dehydrogenase-like protein (mu-crystallin family)